MKKNAFFKKSFGICLLFIATLLPLHLMANGQETFSYELKEIAKEYGCYEDIQHYSMNEKGVKPPFYWGFIEDLPPADSVVFWCNYKDGEKEKSKIVIHVDSPIKDMPSKSNPFHECTGQIKDVIGSSTGIWVENDTIWTGFEDGIYYFCVDGKWKNNDWH
jgi:hypothetical protein